MPINGVIEIASREIRRLDSFAQDILDAREDTRDIVVSADTPYFGARMQGETLTIGATLPVRARRFDDWLRASLIIPGDSRGAFRPIVMPA